MAQAVRPELDADPFAERTDDVVEPGTAQSPGAVELSRGTAAVIPTLGDLGKLLLAGLLGGGGLRLLRRRRLPGGNFGDSI